MTLIRNLASLKNLKNEDFIVLHSDGCSALCQQSMQVIFEMDILYTIYIQNWIL